MDVLLKQFKAKMSYGRQAPRQKAYGKVAISSRPAPSHTVDHLRFRHASGIPNDLEASTPAKCILHEGLHGMQPEDMGLMDDDEDDDVDVDLVIATGSTSLKDLIKGMNADEKDKLPDPFEGNIYKAFAFGISNDWSWNTVGMGIIVILQLIAPAAIAFTYYDKLDLSRDRLEVNWPSKWEATTAATWEKRMVSIFKTFMVVALLICMLLNAISQNQSEAATWTKAKLLWDGIRFDYPRAIQPYKKLWLFTGAFINCSMLTWLSCCTFILTYFCEDLVDVLMNILALMFIFRLDDIDSAFGFFGSGDWDRMVMGKLAEDVVICSEVGMYSENGMPFGQICEETNANNPDFDGETGTLDPHFKEAGKEFLGWQEGVFGGTCCCYTLTSLFLYASLIIFPLIYVGVKGVEPPAKSGVTEEQFKNVTAQLAKLIAAGG